MIEIIDNAVQLGVLMGCCIYTILLFMRTREQVWFLLTCYYGAYALGLVYWFLFLLFYSEFPKLSPVSDLSWIASILFLIVLQNTLCSPAERGYRPPLAWAAPIFCTIMCLFFFRWGDYFLNILWAIMMGGCGYLALRGLLFVFRKSNEMHNRKHFYIAVLISILLAFGLHPAILKVSPFQTPITGLISS